MDHHTVNSQSTGLLFLSLKPRLLKCTTSVIENGINRKNDLRAVESQFPNSASTRIGERGLMRLELDLGRMNLYYRVKIKPLGPNQYRAIRH
jgi:hypothetical protein